MDFLRIFPRGPPGKTYKFIGFPWGFPLDFLWISLGDPQGAYISRVSAFLEISLGFSLDFLPVSLGFSLDFPRGPPRKTYKFIGFPWGFPLDFLLDFPEGTPKENL